MDFYLQVFLEALLNTLSPFFTEVTAAAMRAFGGYELAFAAAVAALGGIAAALLLWALGRGLYYAGQHPKIAFKPERYDRLYQDVHRYGVWLLLLAWLPIGFAMVIAAGLFHIPLRIAMPLLMVGMGVHYTVLLVL